MGSSLAALFQMYTELDKPPIIELLNTENKPVGALYLDKLRYKNFIISETDTSEKYYLYNEGIGVYFSYFKKITQ